MSLVVVGESPGDDLYLNGESLGYLDWTSIMGYSSAEMAISEGTYELVSANGRNFATYIYSHETDDRGAGYALLPSESSRPTTSTTSQQSSATTTTTQSPSSNDTLPQLMTRVNGTAFSSDGQEISAVCAVVSIYVSTLYLVFSMSAAIVT